MDPRGRRPRPRHGRGRGTPEATTDNLQSDQSDQAVVDATAPAVEAAEPAVEVTAPQVEDAVEDTVPATRPSTAKAKAGAAKAGAGSHVKSGNTAPAAGASPATTHAPVLALATGPIAIGVDVGGSGIKAAAVDLNTGLLVSERHRVLTPQPSTTAAVVATIARLVKRVATEAKAGPDVPVGVGFPSPIIDGVTKTAANVDPGWVDFDADTALRRALKRPVHVVNDADAAGVAEMRFGIGAGEMGTVLLITLGTGTGSALFYDGRLVPNLELGHMEIRGRDAERRSAAAARVRRGISWKAWAMDLDEHLLAIEKLFSPRLFIIGGGVSKRSERFMPRLTVRARVVPARLLNDAGIVGAAMAAAEMEAKASG